MENEIIEKLKLTVPRCVELKNEFDSKYKTDTELLFNQISHQWYLRMRKQGINITRNIRLHYMFDNDCERILQKMYEFLTKEINTNKM